jgi:LysM repeat protein
MFNHQQEQELITERRSTASVNLIIPLISSILLTLVFVFNAQGQEDEETYDISLVQTAEVDREIVKVENRKVMTETYTIKEGEHVWKILRNRGLLEKQNLMELLTVLKKLNSSLDNLDVIHPGEKIIIPLVISPLGADENIPEALYSEPAVPIESIENIERYTVRSGDRLIKIIKNHYDIPDELLYDEYLDQLKKINPHIGSIDSIYPGQKIRLPVYSQKVVRAPVKKPSFSASSEEEYKNQLLKIGTQLGEIFNLMGEEWIQKGEHFIPLETGGQVSLNAESYPVLNIRNGNKIILDLHNELPDKMADLIVSSWKNYRIVRLDQGDNLEAALDRILKQCGYDMVFDKNASYNVKGEISVILNADRIIRRFPEPSPAQKNIMAVNLVQGSDSRTPENIRDFLKTIGISVIDYPASTLKEKDDIIAVEIIEIGDSRDDLIRELLDLAGIPFVSDSDISVYRGENSGFKVIISADYLLNIRGREAIIDLHGLGTEMVNLLKEHNYRVISLSNPGDALEMGAGLLEFIGVDSQSGMLPFDITGNGENSGLRLIIKGIDFRDKDNLEIFATDLTLPNVILEFLAARGKKMLQLRQISDLKEDRINE